MTKIEKLVDTLEKYQNYVFASDTDKITLKLLLELAMIVEESERKEIW